MGRFNAKFESSDDLKRWTDKHIEREKYKEEQLHFQSEHKDDIDYESVCKRRNIIASIPFFIGLIFCPLFFVSGKIIESAISFLGLTLLSAIGITVASRNNLKDAELYELSDISSKRLNHEKINYNAGKFGILASLTALFFSAKNNIKQISNPDSWKEMK